MAKRKIGKRIQRKKAQHNLMIFCLKIIAIFLLMLIPFNLFGNTATQPTDMAYWPPVIAQLESAYAANPQNQQVKTSLANAYNNYGVLLAQNKEWAQAQSYLLLAIELSSDPNAIKKNLSNVYAEQGMELHNNRTNMQNTTYSSNAVKQLAEKAIQYDPNNAGAYLLLGDAEYVDQNMQAAQRAWQHAADLLPNNAQIQKRMAQINRESNAETDMNTVFNAYFNIKIDPSVANNPNFDINTLLNFAHDTVGRDLQYTGNVKIPVVVYNKDEYKQTMVDAPGWSEAAYDGKIRLAIGVNQSNFKQVTSDIVHEYTHVVVEIITNNNCPRWFNEGLAKYEEYLHGIPPRIYMLGLAYNTNQIISWDKINDALISPDKNTALLAYQQAFSFVYFLIDRYGMYKVVALLRALGTGIDFDAAVQQTYNTTFDNLNKNWRLWLTNFITNWAEVPTTSADQVTYR